MSHHDKDDSMTDVSRRGFAKRAAVAAGAAALLPIVAGRRAVEATAGDTYDGTTYDQGGQVFNIKSTAYGATGNAVKIAGAGSIGAFQWTFTWTNGNFVPGDAGKLITIQGAGLAGAVLSAKIQTFVSATQVTLNTSALTGVTNKDFAYGTDDTVAIANAIAAADAVEGTIFIPPGMYMIKGSSNPQSGGGMLAIGQGGNGTGGAIGCGGRPGSPTPSVFLCADGMSGIAANGWARYEGFMVDGNNISPTTIQSGVLAGAAGSYGTFIDVWARNSAGNGWVVYGSQNHAYYSCGSIDSADDGLYIDGGAGGLDFFDFEESGSGRYGIHGDDDHQGAGGYIDHTGNNHFFGGSLSSVAGGRQGTSKVFLRNCIDWKFLGVTIIGDNLTGPTVDLAQGSLYAYGNDFTGCTISSTVTPGGADPGHACFKVSEAPFGTNPYTFLKTDGVRFLSGDTSVHILASGNYLYSSRGWVADGTVHGPIYGSTSGTDTTIHALLAGRTGRWITVTISSTAWDGTVMYRMNADGTVQLKGTVKKDLLSGNMFTLPSGYFPTTGGNSQFLAAQDNGLPGSITISTTGVVNGSATTGITMYLDGISLSVN